MVHHIKLQNGGKKYLDTGREVSWEGDKGKVVYLPSSSQFHETAWYELTVKQQKLFVISIQRTQKEFRYDRPWIYRVLISNARIGKRDSRQLCFVLFWANFYFLYIVGA